MVDRALERKILGLTIDEFTEQWPEILARRRLDMHTAYAQELAKYTRPLDLYEPQQKGTD